MKKYITTLTLVAIGLFCKAQYTETCFHAVIYCGTHKIWNVDSTDVTKNSSVMKPVKLVAGNGVKIIDSAGIYTITFVDQIVPKAKNKRRRKP